MKFTGQKKKKMNKKGSYTVLATILFSSMMILAAASVHGAGENAISAAADDFGTLWGRSILAEYDRNLKGRYGIFAFNGNELQVEEKLRDYISFSCQDKKYIDFQSCKCELEEYELQKSENFSAQIKDAVAYDAKPTPVENSNSTEKQNAAAGTDRYIKNQRIIKALPSGGKGESVGIFALADKIKESKSAGDIIDDAAENIYIFRFFKDCMNERGLGETYFNNEIEYIITGKLSDNDAKKKVKTQLTLLRNGLNLAYLYSCSEKRNAALAAAELIMPTAPVITQALILEGWAYMEAVNDLKLLYAGEEVPLIKKDENWATSLENILVAEYGFDSRGNRVSEKEQNRETKNYIKPQKIEGKNYEEYLKILVAALPKETKKLRILDIIQINMKYLYCEYFLICDYYTGVKYSMEINGRKHEFDEKY